MEVVALVAVVWKKTAKPLRGRVRAAAMLDRDAAFMMRCKIVLNLSRGESPLAIHRILGCSRSQVYRVAARFVKDGVAGLMDGRVDNGTTKADDMVSDGQPGPWSCWRCRSPPKRVSASVAAP